MNHVATLARAIVGASMLCVPVVLFAEFGYRNGWVAIPFWMLVWLGAEFWRKVSP